MKVISFMKAFILSLILLFILLQPAICQNPIISNDSIVILDKLLKKNKNLNFAILPGPVYGVTQKLGIMVLPMLVYNPVKKDTLSPPSISGLVVYFDFAGSWLAAVYQSFYWDQNKWRGYSSLGIGDLRLKFFGIGQKSIISSSSSNYVKTHQHGIDVSLTCFRKIWRSLYGGLEYHYYLSTFEGTDSTSEAKVIQSGVPLGKLSESVLVPAMVWDDRDNIFWSTTGFYARLNFQFANNIFFSSRDYYIISGIVNGYHSLLKGNNKMILAWHFFSQSAWGKLPYITDATFGEGDNVTGYTLGKYVDYSEITAQTELRYEVWKFISAGGYLGTGKVFHSYDVFGQSAWLHFAGLRVYFNLIPSRNIRVRLDAAIGRKDYGFYIGIGQGF
jgi:hypothetical protein